MAKNKKEEEITLKLKVFEKGQRKGKLYLYVKKPGQKGTYYAYSENMPVKELLKYYTKGTKNRKEIYEIRKKANQIIEKRQTPKIRIGTPIKQTIQKGTSSVKIRSVEKITHSQIRNKNKELLKPLINHPKILEIMSEEENMKKVRNSIECRIKIKGKGSDGKTKTLATVNIVGKTLNEVINDLKKATRKGEEVKDFSPEIKKKLEAKGKYKYKHKNNGYLSHIEITSKFRKGR